MDRNYYADKDCDWVRVSLSARRAWIETTRYISSQRSRRSLSARRAWIETQAILVKVVDFPGRSPQGERG